jgi:thioredoxin-like negative regulator of GroEL
MASWIQDVTDATFETGVLQSGKPVLVYCWAPGVPEVIGYGLDRVPGMFQGNLTIVRLELEANPKTRDAYKQMRDAYEEHRLPALVLFKQGEPVAAQAQPMPLLPPEVLVAQFVAPHLQTQL